MLPNDISADNIKKLPKIYLVYFGAIKIILIKFLLIQFAKKYANVNRIETSFDDKSFGRVASI